MKKENIYQMMFLTFFGMLGSIIVGFVFFNKSIFIPANSNFQFVVVGIVGSLFFSLLEFGSSKEQIFSMFFILVLHLIIFTGRYISLAFIIRDVFYLGAIFLSIKIYHSFLQRYPKLNYFLRSFALVLFYGVISTLFIIIVFMINTGAGFPPKGFLYIIARNSILIAVGVGLGIDFYLLNQKKIQGLFSTNRTIK